MKSLFEFPDGTIVNLAAEIVSIRPEEQYVGDIMRRPALNIICLKNDQFLVPLTKEWFGLNDQENLEIAKKSIEVYAKFVIALDEWNQNSNIILK